MDVERILISRILADKNLGPVVDAGITSQFFLDPLDHHVYESIIEFNTKHGSVPSISAMLMDYPEYKFIKSDEPLSFLLEEIQRKHALALLSDSLSQAVDYYDARDPQSVIGVLMDVVNQIATDIPNGRDVDLTETGQERLKRYYELRDNPDFLLGYPTGFESIDKATQGLQPEHLVTVVGPPKVGKSSVLILIAMAAWMAGHTVLMFTFEMSNDEMSERFDAFKAGISASRLRSGSLKKEEWEKLERTLRQIESMPPFWFSADSSGASTLSGIAAKVNKLKPDILFVDGIYMMTDEITGDQNSWQSLTNLTRGFKKLAQNKQIPIVISSQVLESKMDSKKGITSNSIAYSSSFAQDSNTIIGVERTESPEINKIKVVLSRNCPPMETFIQWDWENGNFTEMDENPFIELEEESSNGKTIPY